MKIRRSKWLFIEKISNRPSNYWKMLNLQKSSCVFRIYLQNVNLQGPEVHSGGKVVALEGNRQPDQKKILLGRRGRVGPREGKVKLS